MRMTPQGLLCTVVAVSTALLVSGCTSDGSDSGGASDSSATTGLVISPTLAQIQDSGKLRACIDPEFKPQVYLDESNQPAGLDVELTKKVAEALEAEVEFTQTSFDGLIAGIQSGRCDMALSGVTPRGARALAVTFAKPTVVASEVLLVPADDSRSTLEEFNSSDLTFCVQKGTGSETDTTRYFPDAKQTALTSAQDCILSVATGKSDAHLTDTVTAAGALEAQKGLKAVFPEGVRLPAAPSGAIVPLGDIGFATYLDVFFGEFINNGDYLPLCQQFMGDACDVDALLAQRGNF